MLEFLKGGTEGLFRLTMVEKAQLQEHEVAGHITYVVRKQLTRSDLARTSSPAPSYLLPPARLDS